MQLRRRQQQPHDNSTHPMTMRHFQVALLCLCLSACHANPTPTPSLTHSPSSDQGAKPTHAASHQPAATHTPSTGLHHTPSPSTTNSLVPWGRQAALSQARKHQQQQQTGSSSLKEGAHDSMIRERMRPHGAWGGENAWRGKDNKRTPQQLAGSMREGKRSPGDLKGGRDGQRPFKSWEAETRVQDALRARMREGRYSHAELSDRLDRMRARHGQPLREGHRPLRPWGKGDKLRSQHPGRGGSNMGQGMRARGGLRPQLPTRRNRMGESMRSKGLGGSMFPHHLKGTANNTLIQDQFTVQIMTFKRPEYLKQAIQNLVTAPSLKKVVVIWNDEEQGRSYAASELPRFLRKAKLPKPVEIVVTRSNDVTSRWKPQGRIVTQCVFNMDDDTTVDVGTLEFGFNIWKQHKQQVIGFFDRVIYLNETTKEYLYGYDAGVVSPEKYGIVIGKAWMANVDLLRLAEKRNDTLLIKIQEFLHDPKHEQKGCDDIAWNMFLHMRGAAPPIGLAGVRMDDIFTYDGQKTTGYSAVSETDPDGWTKYRTHCIAGLLKVMGLKKPDLPPSPVQQYLVPQVTRSEFATSLAGSALSPASFNQSMG